MEELTQHQQHAWKRRVTKESLCALLNAGFDLQTDFYDVPIVGIMALRDFPYPNIREVMVAMFWGAKSEGRKRERRTIDKDFYEKNPHLRFHPDERLEVLESLGCMKYPARFYDLTVQELLSAVFYAPDYIAEYTQYYVMFFERKGLDRILCFVNRDDILNRYQRFSKR